MRFLTVTFFAVYASFYSTKSLNKATVFSVLLSLDLARIFVKRSCMSECSNCSWTYIQPNNRHTVALLKLKTTKVLTKTRIESMIAQTNTRGTSLPRAITRGSFGGKRVFNPYLWTKFDTQSEEKWEEDSSDDKHAGLSGLMTKSPRSVCNQLFSLNQATTISFLSKYILSRVKSSRLPFSRNSLRENTGNE